MVLYYLEYYLQKYLYTKTYNDLYEKSKNSLSLKLENFNEIWKSQVNESRIKYYDDQADNIIKYFELNKDEYEYDFNKICSDDQLRNEMRYFAVLLTVKLNNYFKDERYYAFPMFYYEKIIIIKV